MMIPTFFNTAVSADFHCNVTVPMPSVLHISSPKCRNVDLSSAHVFARACMICPTTEAARFYSGENRERVSRSTRWPSSTRCPIPYTLYHTRRYRYVRTTSARTPPASPPPGPPASARRAPALFFKLATNRLVIIVTFFPLTRTRPSVLLGVRLRPRRRPGGTWRTRPRGVGRRAQTRSASTSRERG